MNRRNAPRPRRQSNQAKLASLRAKVRPRAATRPTRALQEPTFSHFDLSAGGNFNTMVIGRSGSGKSVLLTEIAARITVKENLQ